MAELDIGQPCGAEHCGQLDFLPFVCDSCSKAFCLQHRSRDSHGCPEASDSATDKQSEHQKEQNLSPKYELVSVTDRVTSERNTLYPCSYAGCSGKELIEVLCPYCERPFCLKHRHQPDHECDKLEIPKPRMAATQQLVKEIVDSKKSVPAAKGRRGAKSAETAAKVALMKLKLHAAGDKSLPQTERVYFQVFLPKGTKEKSKPMFFCKKWSIGKTVDYAASLASLKNENNKAAAKKLRVCHTETGQVLPFDNTLEAWLSDSENPLFNGGNIILEYIDNGLSELGDASTYLT